jgi:hypothetical protein
MDNPSRIIEGMVGSCSLVPHGTKFNFAKELRKARRALEDRVAAYAAEHPELGYRDLCRSFGVSLGALSKIMRRCRKRRNASLAAAYIVRHKDRGQDVTTIVTVTGTGSDAAGWLLRLYYHTDDVSKGDDPSVARRDTQSARKLAALFS